MKKISEIIRRYKVRKQTEQKRYIRAEFQVVERNGVLWLTHNGTAFAKVETNVSASDVAKLLSDARCAAILFESL